MATLLESYMTLDARLADKGFPATPEWWKAEVARFYNHPTAKTWVAQVGRGGAKSTHSVKTGVNETLFGKFLIQPGERHYYVFVSENTSEANGRLRLIEAYLQALGVGYERHSDTIDLTSLPRGFRVLACRIGAVSGFRTIGCSLDEAAKWSNEGTNPAEEIAMSLRATLVTHPEARTRVFSSPMAMMGYHYDAVSAGNNDFQIVSQAPSWVANPDAISEARTRELARNDREWRREYLAEPSSAAAGAFDSEAIGAAFREFDATGKLRGQPVLIIDASSGRSDSWTWAFARWVRADQPRYLSKEVYVPMSASRGGDPKYVYEYKRDENGEPIPNPEYDASPPCLVVDGIDGVEGSFWKQTTGAAIVAQLANTCKKIGVQNVFGDQREALMLESEFARHGLKFNSIPWTNENKAYAVEKIRRWLKEGTLVLPPHEKLKRELMRFEEKILPTGFITYGARSGHDDYASLLLTAAMADHAGYISNSPYFYARKTVRRDLRNLYLLK